MTKQASNNVAEVTISYIALGSNAADATSTPRDIVQHALQLIAQRFDLQTISQLYTTPAFPAESGPDFVNAVAKVGVVGGATDFLNALHQIEADAGRTRDVRWGPRSLDLDILDFAGQVAPSLAVYNSWRNLPFEDQKNRTPDQLILPHPRLQDRAFVLVPLCDIAPDWVHPVLGQTARQLCASLPDELLRDIKPIET